MGEITSITTEESWLYLAAIKDQCTCEIVAMPWARG